MEKTLPIELSTRKNYLVWIETVLLCMINAAAFSGNFAVCYAVYRNHRLRTLTNMFVVALAASDVLMSICCMPFSVATLYQGTWIFGERFCRFHGFCVFTLGIVSVNTMGIIAVNRYFCVVRPLKYMIFFNTRKNLLYTAVVWCAGFIGSVPPFFFKTGGFEFQAGKAMCLYTFEANIAYTTFIGCVSIITPFVLMIICYAKVFYKVSRSNRNFSLENNPHHLSANVGEAKVTKTLATVMAGFALCWIPILIIDQIDVWRGEYTLPRQVYLTYGFLVYLSCTINPFIYGAMNKVFRQEFKAIMAKMFCLQSCRFTRITEKAAEKRKSRRARRINVTSV